MVGSVQNVKDCMVRTEIDNLRLIASGPIPPNPSELLGSRRMEAILTQVRENADLVILDTPPTLTVTDAAVLAQKVDGDLLVTNAGKTRREAARHALEGLLRVGANLVGVVLNAVPTHRSGHYYYKDYRDSGERRKPSLCRRNGTPAVVQRLAGRRR